VQDRSPKPRPSSPNKNNHRHQGPRPQQAGGQSSQNGHGQQGSGQNHNPNHRRKKFFRHRNHQDQQARREGGSSQSANSPQTQQQNQKRFLERSYEKYINLLDQHLIARKKFHDLYYRADHQQLNRLERIFDQTLKDLRTYEESLSPELKEYVESRVNGLKLDQTYTLNHPSTVQEHIESVESLNVEVIFQDPHLLQSQIQCNFENDTEESVGTMDDYLRYKG